MPVCPSLCRNPQQTHEISGVLAPWQASTLRGSRVCEHELQRDSGRGKA